MTAAMGTTNQDGHLVPNYSYNVPQRGRHSCWEWRKKADDELRTEGLWLFLCVNGERSWRRISSFVTFGFWSWWFKKKEETCNLTSAWTQFVKQPTLWLYPTSPNATAVLASMLAMCLINWDGGWEYVQLCVFGLYISALKFRAYD